MELQTLFLQLWKMFSKWMFPVKHLKMVTSGQRRVWEGKLSTYFFFKCSCKILCFRPSEKHSNF